MEIFSKITDLLTTILVSILLLMIIVLWTIYWRESKKNEGEIYNFDNININNKNINNNININTVSLPWPVPHKSYTDNQQYHFVIVDNFIGEPIMSQLRERCPSDNDKEAIEFSKEPIGEELAKTWNSHPEESYYNQGIIVRRENPHYFFNTPVWFDWVSNVLNLKNKIKSCLKWQYHTFTNNANGIWLHTDQFKNMRNKRSVLILMYVHEEWNIESGGELKLFQRKEVDKISHPYIPLIKGYQFNTPMSHLKNSIVRADTVGGEASINGIFEYHTVNSIQPIPNRIVIIDHTNFENIHAVLPCNSKKNRLVVQQWLSID